MPWRPALDLLTLWKSVGAAQEIGNGFTAAVLSEMEQFRQQFGDGLWQPVQVGEPYGRDALLRRCHVQGAQAYPGRVQ